ncbi:hypothetical protein HPG69_009396 [Diceros bicornis minor]|uniref:Small ribosomal subunit protein uS7 domain-containing protein n=1 Tax=Diceros bicornis minor TaxID=77932 RepID=A0A7J7F3W4_DICBM|nr:hypothetical protein HPG69_009396 [Diceros bicornis minor]
MGLRPILKGDRFYQVPVPLAHPCGCFQALKWTITECQEKQRLRMVVPEGLSQELLEAFQNQGGE